MAVLDFNTGKDTGEEPVKPISQNGEADPATNKTQHLGVLDFKTGLPVIQEQEVQTETEEPQENLPQEDLIRSLAGTSIADIASDVVGAPVGQVVGGFAGKAAAGLETLAKAPFIGLDEAITAGQQTEQSISEAFAPQTELGKESSNQVFSALAHLNKIPAGWGGIAELIETQDPNQAAEVVKSVEQKGLPKYMGDLNFEAYGSPLLASITTVIPELAALFHIGGKGVKEGRIDKARKDLEIIDQIESGTAGKNLAEYKLQNRDEWSQPTQAEIDVLSEKLKVDKEFAREMVEAMPTVNKKKSGKKAISQEWDKSLLGLVQASSKADIDVMQRQLNIYDAARDNMALKAKGRPIYEAGKAIGSRVDALVKERKIAGKRVGAAAESLRGVEVNYAPAVDKFINSLLDDGVVINNGRPITNVRQYRNIDFRNSPYDGSKASEDLIRKHIKRMTEKDFALDGFNIHTTKKNLPHTISTAKKSEGGLVPKAESLLNELRSDLNGVLRDSSDEYRLANDSFIEAVTPLNALNDAMPKDAQVSWEGINENNAGKQLRIILSNYANADNLYQAIQDMDTVTKKLGYNFNDDAIKQAFFAIGLDRRLGAFAEQSLQGVTEAGGRVSDLPTSATDAGLKTIGKLMRNVKRVDDDSAIKAMREYLKESKQGKK